MLISTKGSTLASRRDRENNKNVILEKTQIFFLSINLNHLKDSYLGYNMAFNSIEMKNTQNALEEFL